MTSSLRSIDASADCSSSVPGNVSASLLSMVLEPFSPWASDEKLDLSVAKYATMNFLSAAIV